MTRKGHILGSLGGPGIASLGCMAIRPVLAVVAIPLFVSGCYRSFSLYTDAEAEPDSPPDSIHSDCLTDWVGDCVSVTGGDCNIIDQCGCCPGQACAFRLDVDTCEFVERCVGAPHTTLMVGDPCSTGDCPTGSICLIYLPDTITGHCFEWCEEDAHCRVEGEWCNLPSRFDDDHVFCPHLVSYPLPLCSDGTFGVVE